MISPEISIGQIEKSSPAQICADASNLAIEIFGSNSECRAWCVKFIEINSEANDSESFEGFKFPASAHTRTHTHAHTHY